MHPEAPIDGLLHSACAAIRFRSATEILGLDRNRAELREAQAQILKADPVRRLLAQQRPDGWLGPRFHGYDSHEGGVRILAEMGVPADHPPFSAALQVVEQQAARIEAELGRVGRALDDGGFGGSRMMRAAALAHAGLEGNALVREQIQVALEGFGAVVEAESIEAISEPYRGKRFFRPGVRWPGIYHLRLLAHTRSWRSPEAHGLMTQAATRLAALSPIPPILVRVHSQWIAPPSFAMQDFDTDLATMDPPQWMMWFHRMELLARLGLAWDIPALARQVSRLGEVLQAGDGWFALPLSHEYFARWGAYTGLRLEPDWKSPARRQYDLTFRSLLILHDSGG